jgi:putative membrane protein
MNRIGRRREGYPASCGVTALGHQEIQDRERTMKRTTWLMAPVLAAALALPTAGPVSAGSADVAKQDKTFLRQNAQTDLAEISLGKYVRDHTRDNRVRKFAAMVVEDHQKALDEVRAAAKDLDVSLPNAPSQLQRQNANLVMRQDAATLDRRYVRGEVTAHQTSIEQTKTELNDGRNPRVLKFARTYLPVAEDHLKDAKKLS